MEKCKTRAGDENMVAILDGVAPKTTPGLMVLSNAVS